MATRFFLTNTLADVDPTSNTEYELRLGSAGDAAVSETGTGDTDGIRDLIDDASGSIRWISKPLSAVTINNDVLANLRMAEAAMTSNQQAWFDVVRVDNDGVSNPTTIVSGNRGVEMGTTEAAQNFTATIGAAISISAGQRIRVTVGVLEIGAGAADTVTLWFDGPTAGASGDSWIEFTETITEQAAAAGSLLVPRRPFRHLVTR